MSGDSGARHDRVSIKDDVFFAMPINVPSAKEQERISLFLDAIERRIETQRTLVETLKKYKRGLLNKVFSNINGNIYPTVYLSKVADFLQGLTYSPSDVSVSGYLVLRSSNIQNGVLSFDDCVYVDKKVDERDVYKRQGVHFVAISNSVDSNDQNSNEFAPFLNIMNEWYLRDLSRKQKTAIRIKGESGKPTTNIAIYGYKKDPTDKYHWLIDEEAAAVVRRIFRMNVEGIGPYEIARILYEDKVETPAVYLGKKGIGFWKSKEDFSNPYNWSGHIVGKILSKPEYIGHTVNFRSHKESYNCLLYTSRCV